MSEEAAERVAPPEPEVAGANSGAEAVQTADPVVTSSGAPSVLGADSLPEGAGRAVVPPPMPGPNVLPTYAVQVQVGENPPVLIATGLDRSAANNLRQAILDGGVHVVPE